MRLEGDQAPGFEHGHALHEALADTALQEDVAVVAQHDVAGIVIAGTGGSIVAVDKVARLTAHQDIRALLA